MSNEQPGTPVPPQVPQNDQAPQQGWQAIGQQPAQPAQPAPPAQPQAWQAPTPAPQPQAWQQPNQGQQQQGWQAPPQQGWQQPNQGQQQAWNQQASAQQQWGQQQAAGPTAPTWEQLKAIGRYQIPPEYPAATFNPESFSIASFFFSWIWYMVKGMWQKGLLLLGAGIIISIFTAGFGGIALAIYAGMYGHRDYMRFHNSKVQFWW
jgi:hypothetical protein